MTDASETTLHANVVRVVEAGDALGLDIEPFHFPDGTKTAADAAAAIGVDVGQIVKSLIFAVDGEVVLSYVSGRNQLDEASSRPRPVARRARVSTPTPYERRPASRSAACRRSATPTDLRVFIDPDLLQYDEVWAAAGTWTDVFAIAPDDLVRVSGGAVTDLKR